METNGTETKERFVLKLVVDNHKGVMARIATLLARKGYNISSITVGKHLTEGEASIVLTIYGSEDEVQQAKKMLGKLINVITIEAMHKSEVVERELCLLKVATADKKKAEGMLDGMNSRTVQEGKGFVVLEIVDYPAKVSEFVEKAAKEIKIMDISRSGSAAI